MNVLEKILEEIEEKFKTADAEKCDCEELCDVEDWYDSGYIDGQLSAHGKCMDIIRSHMDEASDMHGKRLIDANALDEEVRNFFLTIIGDPSQAMVVRECKESFRRIIDEQPTVYEANDWIPVDERLPEAGDGKYYPLLNVQTSYGAVKCGFYRVRDDRWYIYEEFYNEFMETNEKEVVAWQTFPEPYKEG
ncbi:hypothetical protein [Mediterraneibacter gnavus]|uniref:hypothetical protein n=1 Tax=Mediterraneibacter gnavus TaxID=33038 RepID=UPI00356ADB55